MNDWLNHLRDVLRPLGDVSIRRMFGGHGVFRGADMFGIVVDEMLYLKVDPENQEAFTTEGLPPFQYLRGGKVCQLGFYQAPPECFEDTDEMTRWVKPALEAAARATRARQRKGSKKKKGAR